MTPLTRAIAALVLGASCAGLPGAPAAAQAASCISAATGPDSAENRIRLYTICLERGLYPETRAAAHNNRGVAYLEVGDVDRALEDFSQAIRHDDDWGSAYLNRAEILVSRGELAAAEADLDQAVRLPPARIRPRAYALRAELKFFRGDCAGAIADYSEAIRRRRREASFLNSKAWYRATCPDPADRNGQEAVELAERAVELEDAWPYRDTLAAAYAEAGRFDDAVREQEVAIAAASGLGVDTSALRERLELYRSGAPYHAPTPAGN